MLTELELNCCQWILEGLIFLTNQCAYCIFVKKKMLNLKKGLLGALPRRLPVYWSTAYILFLHFIETIILATQIFFKIYSHLLLSWLSEKYQSSTKKYYHFELTCLHKLLPTISEDIL